MSRFDLGVRVRFTDTVQKVRDEQRTVSWESAGLPTEKVDVIDRETGHWSREERPLREGIVVGSRSLAKYTVYTETDYGEYGQSYGTYTVSEQIPGTSQRAWLVAFALRRKPVLVLDEHIEKSES